MPRISYFPPLNRHCPTALGILLVLLLSFNSFAQASSVKPTCQVLLQFYETRLVLDFKFKAPPEGIACDSAPMKAIEAFYFIHQISETLQTKGVDQNFYDWIKVRIKTIEFENEFKAFDQNSNVTIGAVNLAIASADLNGTLTIYDRYSTRDLVRRIGTLIHEARHMDADAPPHILCKNGPLAGTLSCDLANQADTTGGAYVHETLFWSMLLNLDIDVIPKHSVTRELRFIKSAHLVSAQPTTTATNLPVPPIR